jgi:hypothetical protein
VPREAPAHSRRGSSTGRRVTATSATSAGGAAGLAHPDEAASVPDRRTLPTVVRAVARQVGLILAFSVPAIVLWWRVWSGHPGSTVSCPCWDSGQEIWFISWPAYALSHGLSVFFTSWLWTPSGVNLLNNTSAPLTGSLLSPVTWLFGPIISNNVALTLAPGLTAWSCWLACRRFVGWTPAAIFGGLLFGYAPFVVSSVALGHLSIALLVVPPLTVLVLHEILVRQQIRAWAAGLMLGGLVCIQFMISVEVLALMGLAAAIGVAVAMVLSPHRVAAAWPYALRAVAVAAGVAVIVLVWPAWFLLDGPRHIVGAPFQGIRSGGDGHLFNLWNAGNSAAAVPIPGSSTPIVIGPPGDFVGFGVLVLAALALVVACRRRVAWIFAAVALACIVLSWGSTLSLSATHAITATWLPFRILANLPIFRDILPVRFAIFTDLALAILIAVGIDSARQWPGWHRLDAAVTGARARRRHSALEATPAAHRTGLAFAVAVVGAAALAFIPQWATYQVPIATQPVALPPWFATTGTTLPAGSTVLTYPFPMSATVVSQPMVWQAVDGMRFRLAGGYAKVPGATGHPLTIGPPRSAVRLLSNLTSGRTGPPSAAQLQSLRSALTRWGVSWIVVTLDGPLPVQAAAVFTAVTMTAPHLSHDAWVWKLTPPLPTASFSAQAASRALEACRAQMGVGAPDRTGSLPEAANDCVMAHLPGS